MMTNSTLTLQRVAGTLFGLIVMDFDSAAKGLKIIEEAIAAIGKPR